MRFSLASRLAGLACLLALAACGGHGAAAREGASAPPAAMQVIDSGQPPQNRCDAQAAQFLVGQPFGADTLARALAAAGADTARMLRPDSMITKEYTAGRLNVTVDANNRVTRVHCG
jgi:hypothetical protein